MVGFALRLTHPDIMARMNEVDDSIDLSFEKTKGVFYLLIIGCTTALLVQLLLLLKDKASFSRIIRRVKRYCMHVFI